MIEVGCSNSSECGTLASMTSMCGVPFCDACYDVHLYECDLCANYETPDDCIEADDEA